MITEDPDQAVIHRDPTEESEDRGATFDPTRLYRYLLWRRWGVGAPYLLAIGLNPSTADETVDDATMRLLRVRAKMMGMSAFYMTNLFPYRATQPSAMKRHHAPLGPKNDAALNDATLLSRARGAACVLACWGNDGAHLDRASAVLAMLRRVGITVHHLGLTKSGQPKHPLRIPYSVQPEPFSLPRKQ